MARKFERRTIVLLSQLCLLLGLSPLVASAFEAPSVSGSLSTVEGVRVLRLWGTANERGFAHGYLLGQEIMKLIESAVLDPRTMDDPAKYESGVINGVLKKINFRPEHEEELNGMLAGITARLGPDAIRLKRLGRSLTVADLKAVNTLADWNTFFCSSFSAWGELEADGQLITGRNLDYFTLSGLSETHVVIVYQDPGVGKKRWVSVAWPSLIGAYTAMNEDGVTVSIHDVRGPDAAVNKSFVSRSLSLREAIESASAETAVDDVKRVLGRSPVMCGNNIHVSAPYQGQAVPAAVLEWDGDGTADGGATLRVAAVRGGSTMNQAILCTNHYRLRGQPQSCNRYEEMEASLNGIVQAGKKIGVETAFQILNSVSVPGTLQSVVYLPNRGELHLKLSTPRQNASEGKAVKLRLSDLWAR